MAELGSTGGNLDNILQYLLQRIEKSGIGGGGTGGGTIDLSNYYTKTEVDNLIPNLTDYATEKWVTEQGYLTSANLTNYATQSWVENKGYLTSVSWENVQNTPKTLEDYGIDDDIKTLLTGYVNTLDFNTFKGGYDNLAAAVNAANGYTDGKARETLNAANANAATIVEQALEDYVKKETLSEYATITWADSKFAKLAEANRFTANNYITGRLYLSNGNYGVYSVCDNNESVYLYRHIAEDYDVTFMRMAKFNGSGLVEIGEQYNPGTLKIGNAYLTYDSKNNALMVSNGSGGAVNLVAMGDVAAFGGLGSGFDTLTDLTLTNKLTAKSIDAQYLSVSNSMQQNIDMGEYDIDNCQNCTCQYMFTDEINLGPDQITEFSASGSYVYITINGARYRISATEL